MGIVEFKNVSYASDKKEILKNVNLNICEGDFITITGPSGSGKSTFLRLINHLISPSSGEIVYRDKNLFQYSPVELRKKIVMCFQMPHLFGETVYDNISFPFEIRKMPVDEGLIEEKLNEFKMHKNFLNQNIKNLSGGEKQRVAIIRSLLFKPDILLLDEITSALDQENTLIVEDIISKMNKESVTVLWITHNPLQAERLGNRRIHIEDGILREVKK
jgi:putative ABC transport system ATP-binding protein